MGCDLRRSRKISEDLGFNPRTRMGCDWWNLYDKKVGDKFQSTHPHGVRQRLIIIPKISFSFNPRTRMGCDCTFEKIQKIIFCFNPRTRMGCDL